MRFLVSDLIIEEKINLLRINEVWVQKFHYKQICGNFHTCM
uniref:Uncharacterized protein n=1 Tax=Arundo donax TaxID=35708 RepID=A0A0A9HKF7_ARUDO